MVCHKSLLWKSQLWIYSFTRPWVISIFSKDCLGKKQNTQACTKIASSLSVPLCLPPLYRRCMIQHSTGKSSVHIVGNVSVELQVLPRRRRRTDFSPELLLQTYTYQSTTVYTSSQTMATAFLRLKSWENISLNLLSPAKDSQRRNWNSRPSIQTVKTRIQ